MSRDIEAIEPDVDGEVALAEKQVRQLAKHLQGPLSATAVCAVAVLAGCTLIARAIYAVEYRINAVNQ